MVLTLPKADEARFHPVSPQAISLAYLSCQKQGLSLATLQQRLKKLVPPAEVDAAVSAMIERGEASLEKSITLTAKGREAANRLLGNDNGQPWETLKDRRLPMIALGLNPDDADVRNRFAKSDALKATTIAIAFGLHKQAMGSLKAVCGELVWQLLRARMPEVVGKGPFPVIDKPGVVERVLLSGLAGIKAKSIPEAITGVAALAVGLEKVDADTLRERLLQIGVGRAVKAPRMEAPSSAHGDANGSAGFASRVREVALTLTTPPFQGRVAIAQVYDAYGKIHADAGSIASFKERLVAAAKARDIELGRLDLPERMSKELRKRSETAWGSDEVHFVITNWK